MTALIGYLPIVAVVLSTLFISFYGLRISRTTSDFYVASRTVKPWWNASAIGGEYLSAASFLGIAGLIVTTGIDALWFPIGYAAGYLMLLMFVAAPLRRSGAYTIPDFAHARLNSKTVRHVTSLLVVIVGFFYIVPQLHGAAITLTLSTGLLPWLGSTTVLVVVSVSVMTGGMRSITFAQAFQYWLKLTAIAVPALFILLAVQGKSHQFPHQVTDFFPALEISNSTGIYSTLSLLLALLFGTLGLPHVLVRFYTNPDGAAARRTTVIVLGLLSLFYLFPTVYGIVGRVFLPELANSTQADATVLLLPGRVFDGLLGELLTALVIAGAFAAFISTTSGLLVSLAGTISQELFGGSIGGFRIAALLAAVVPYFITIASGPLGLAGSIGLVFAFTASTICPLLLLGIWWPRLTDIGALTGMLVGGSSCGLAILLGGKVGESPWRELLAQPAAWTVPLAFLTMIVFSLLTSGRRNPESNRFLTKLHVPERPLSGGTK